MTVRTWTWSYSTGFRIVFDADAESHFWVHMWSALGLGKCSCQSSVMVRRRALALLLEHGVLGHEIWISSYRARHTVLHRVSKRKRGRRFLG